MHLSLAMTLVSAVALQQAPAAQAPPAPTDKAAYWANTDIQNIWKDLEARQVINQRVMKAAAKTSTSASWKRETLRWVTENRVTSGSFRPGAQPQLTAANLLMGKSGRKG